MGPPSTPARTANVAVNVASVVQRSPFRYPGGKTWLIPQARRWLTSGERASVLVEPFLGGGSISLLAGAENLADKVIMVEMDPAVAVVWRVVVSGDYKALSKRIQRFDCVLPAVEAELAKTPRCEVGQAFQTIVRNRVQRGGILAPGAGLMRAGEAGKGVASRWYPQTLVRRIEDIARYRERLVFIEGDALDVMSEYAHDPRAVFFVDPPYTAGGKNAGSRLYGHNQVDHDALFAACRKVRGDILMTYDNTDEVTALAAKYTLVTKPIAMHSTHHAPMTELLIGKNLDWVS